MGEIAVAANSALLGGGQDEDVLLGRCYRLVVHEARDVLSRSEGIDTVIFCCFDAESEKLHKDALAAHRGNAS